VHAEIRIGLFVDRLVVTRQSLSRHPRKPPAFVEVDIVYQDMSTAEDIAKLIDVQAVRLKVREDGSLLGRKSLGGLDQPAPITTMACGQLNKQADSGSYPFGLFLGCLGAPRDRPDRRASHLVRLLRRLTLLTHRLSA
jgi:hypothetical protein